MVPDGVATIKLARLTISAHDTPRDLSTKALNAAVAATHGAAAVHDNIAALNLAIPVYTGRPPHWSGPGPAPKRRLPRPAGHGPGHLVRRARPCRKAHTGQRSASPCASSWHAPQTTRQPQPTNQAWGELMTRDEAIVEAETQAAAQIRMRAGSPPRGTGEWTVVRIGVVPTKSTGRATKTPRRSRLAMIHIPRSNGRLGSPLAEAAELGKRRPSAIRSETRGDRV